MDLTNSGDPIALDTWRVDPASVVREAPAPSVGDEHGVTPVSIGETGATPCSQS